jgi:scyllo-inositol 2-dehydrogenase (NAD+)
MANFTAGLIGCGRMGCFTSEKLRQNLPDGWLPLNHADAIRSVNGLSLDSICDVNESMLSEAGERLQVSKRYTSYQDLITEAKPDMISIATRTKSR